jgi:sulfur carrier protein
MIEIKVNGEPSSVAAGTTVAELVESLGISGQRVAVELDGTVVPRSTHAKAALHAGANVEIVHAIGGG